MKCIGNIVENQWVVTEEDEYGPILDIYIGFTGEHTVITFDDLHFSVELSQDEETLSLLEFPPDDFSYISTDQEILEYISFDVVPGQEYTIKLVASNGGTSFEKVLTYFCNFPPQPFESWIWDETNLIWIAPVDLPDIYNLPEGSTYDWDEDNQQWIIISA